MDTLTFFLHGTGQHEKGRVKTVITALSEACKESGHTLSGPGGKSAVKGEPHFMPGTYEFDAVTAEKVAKKTVIPASISQFIATVTGWGVEQNLQEMLLQVCRQDPPPKRINLVGFSRGADTSLRFANLMYEFYPHVEINIVAIDPVPGFGREREEQGRVIPPNVKHYTSILALNESRAIFRPQDYSTLKPMDFEATKVECLPMLGNHGVLRQFSTDRKGTREASELVQDIAIQRLESWGTIFKNDPKYPIKKGKGEEGTIFQDRYNTSPKGRLFKYSKMMIEIDNYGKFSTVRSVARNREDYSPFFPNCFVNLDHQKLFAKTFPVTYDYMLNPTNNLKKINSNTELSRFPEVQKWLDKTFEAHPKKKGPILFKINKHRLDGNYLKVVMAVHRFKKIPILDSRDKKSANKLLQDCKNILHRGFSDPEAEMRAKVNKFTDDHPKSRFTKILNELFEKKDYSLIPMIRHDLNALRNQSLFQRLVEKIEGTISASREQYYTSVHDALSIANRFVSDPNKSADEMIKVLEGLQKFIKANRESLKINKKSPTEVALEKLVERVTSEKTLVKKSEAIRELRQGNLNVKR